MLQDILDSIESDETNWTKRSVIKMITLQARCRLEISLLEKTIEKFRHFQNFLNIINSILSLCSCTGVITELVFESIRESQEQEEWYPTLTILIFCSITTFLTGAISAFLKTKNYTSLIADSTEAITRLQSIISQIDLQIYTRSANREDFDIFHMRISISHNRATDIINKVGIKQASIVNQEIQLEKQLYTSTIPKTSGLTVTATKTDSSEASSENTV